MNHHLSKKFLRFFILCVLSLSFSSFAQSAYKRDVINKIKNTGNLVIAVRESSIPFSYNDGNDNYIGYSVELCEMVARQIRKNLQLPELNVIVLPVEAKERMDVVATGLADMECGITTNTGERLKKYGFSLAIIAVETRFVSNKKLEILSEEDLRGKTIAVTANSVGQAYMEELNQNKKLNMKIISYKDNYEGFLAVLDGTADLMPNDDVLLASLISSTRSAKESLHLTGKGFQLNTYGIVLPKEDVHFKKLVDDSLRQILTSSQIMEVYNKWFLSPIPPKNIIIGLKPSSSTLEIFSHPHDRALIEK